MNEWIYGKERGDGIRRGFRPRLIIMRCRPEDGYSCARRNSYICNVLEAYILVRIRKAGSVYDVGQQGRKRDAGYLSKQGYASVQSVCICARWTDYCEVMYN